MVSRGVERSIKRRVERAERRSVHQRGGEQVGEGVEGRAQVSAGKNHTVHTTHRKLVSTTRIIGRKRWARRGGMAMVQDTQGKRWKRPQVNRIHMWQEALLTGVWWRDVCPRGRWRDVRHNLVLKVEPLD